jgi:hypothetical protein
LPVPFVRFIACSGGLGRRGRADWGRSRMSLNYIFYLIGALVVIVVVLKVLGLY